MHNPYASLCILLMHPMHFLTHNYGEHIPLKQLCPPASSHVSSTHRTNLSMVSVPHLTANLECARAFFFFFFLLFLLLFIRQPLERRKDQPGNLIVCRDSQVVPANRFASSSSSSSSGVSSTGSSPTGTTCCGRGKASTASDSSEPPFLEGALLCVRDTFMGAVPALLQ